MTPTLRELAEAAKANHIESFRLALACTPERILALLDCIAAADTMRAFALDESMYATSLADAYDAKRKGVP